MTKSTWNRIVRLMEASSDLVDNWRYEEAERIDERVNDILLKAGIDQYLPGWDMITTDEDSGKIEVFDDKGVLIKTYIAFKSKSQEAA